MLDYKHCIELLNGSPDAVMSLDPFKELCTGADRVVAACIYDKDPWFKVLGLRELEVDRAAEKVRLKAKVIFRAPVPDTATTAPELATQLRRRIVPSQVRFDDVVIGNSCPRCAVKCADPTRVCSRS